MLCILSQSHDPYFNLAAEEYLLKQMEDDYFMLYRNEPSLVIGKHQNAMAEINHLFVKDHHINVVRRLSGGGTVYHDLGNINFLFIRAGEPGKLVDFGRFLLPVIEIMDSLGIHAEYGGRNDLIVQGRKISGNAEHVYRNRTLHHGTLLYSSDLNMLEHAIASTPDRYIDRAIPSVRSKVVNISEFLDSPPAVEEFALCLYSGIRDMKTDSKEYSFSPKDIYLISQLAEIKYRRWDWTYGYSPDFEYRIRAGLNINFYELLIHVIHGIIKGIRAIGGDFPAELKLAFEQQMLNQPFSEQFIEKFLLLSGFEPVHK